MPTFEITGPDGHKYRVNAPDGASEDDVLAYAKSQFGSAPPAAPATHPQDVPFADGRSPYSDDELRPEAMAPERPRSAGEVASGIGNEIARGAALGVRAPLRGLASIPDIVAAPAAHYVNAGLDAAGVDPANHQMTFGQGFDALWNKAGLPVPETTGERIVSRVGEGLGGVAGGAGVGRALLATESAPAQAIGKTLSENLGSQAKAVAAGSGLGGVVHEAGGSPRGEIAASLAGGLIPATLGAGYQGASAVARKSLGTVDDQAAALAQRAQELGIPLRASQVGDSRAVRVLDNASRYIPGSSGRAFEVGQQEAFNKAVGRTIGLDDVAKLGPAEYNKARATIGAEFDRLAEASSLKLNPELAQKIRDVKAAAKPFGKEAEDTIQSVVDDLVHRADSGVLSGKAFQSIDSRLGKAIGAGGERSVYLGELQDALRDAVEAQLPAADAQAWAQARAQYRDLKTLEPLISKEGMVSGNISPAQLIGRVNANASGKAAMARGERGDLGDLAAIGQRFIRDPIGSSGTAERLTALQALKSFAPQLTAGGFTLGLGASTPFVSAANAALAGAGAAGASRLTQKVLQNPELVQAMLGQGRGVTALERGLAKSAQPTLLELMQSAGN